MTKSKLMPCPDCEKDISRKADKCPHCGVKVKKKAGLVGTFIILLISLSVFYSMISGNTDTDRTGTINNSRSDLDYFLTSNTRIKDSEKSVLEVEDFNCGHEYGYTITEGRVKNISDKRLENVQAVVQNFDKDGNFINSDMALIEYNPIMPGQTSPFKVMGQHNPLMKRCDLEFKSMFGGSLRTTTK